MKRRGILEQGIVQEEIYGSGSVMAANLTICSVDSYVWNNN